MSPLKKKKKKKKKRWCACFESRGAHEICILVAQGALHCARRGLDKNIISTTAPERAVLSVMSLGVALRTDESGASEAAETFIFLASI